MTVFMFISEFEPRFDFVRRLVRNLFHVYDIKRPKSRSMCSVCCRDMINNRFDSSKDKILVVERGTY